MRVRNTNAMDYKCVVGIARNYTLAFEGNQINTYFYLKFATESTTEVSALVKMYR